MSVRVCAEESTDRAYALKRMRKSAVVQCPEHVFCEQAITRNTAHPFCIRQYASFQDKYHLYFLFDLMNGGDLMDVLVAEAKVIKRRIPQGAWRRACLAPKVHTKPPPSKFPISAPCASLLTLLPTSFRFPLKSSSTHFPLIHPQSMTPTPPSPITTTPV